MLNWRGRIGAILLLMLAVSSAAAQRAPFAAPLAKPAAPSADRGAPSVDRAAGPSTEPSEEMLTFTFPENTELRVLINYVGQRLGIQFLYDNGVGQQRITIKQGTRIPKRTLLSFLQFILQSKGFTLSDAHQPGWKRIVPAAMLTSIATPATRPGVAPAVGAVTRVFLLKTVDAARMDAMIKPFLTQPGGNSISIPEQRLLIVTDFASNMSRIAELVEMLDQPTRKVVVQFVTIEHGDAAELQPKIAQVMQATINTQGVANPAQIGVVEVGSDPRTNQIALIGPAERVAQAVKIVKQFDIAVPFVTRTYQFEYVSPERVDKLMRQMLDPATLKRKYHAGVDKDARLLVVTATEDIQKQIEAMKKAVDVAMTQADSPIQFYKLSNVKAADVLETIRGIQGEQTGGADDFSQDYASKGMANPLSRRRGGRSGSGYGASLDSSRQSFDNRRLGGNSSGMGGTGGMGGGFTGRSTTQPSGSAAGPGGGHETLQTSNAVVTSDPNTNSIIVVADPATQKIYEQLIGKLDKRRPQVLIECTIVTLDTSHNFSLGVDVGVHGGLDATQIITFSSFGVSQPRTVGGAGTEATGGLALIPGAMGFNGALLNSDVADIVLHALVTNSHAKVVSAPRILVNDNATGSLLSTAEQPYTNINVGDTVSTTSFGGYVEAGTSIDLTPHISEANYLQLDYDVSLNKFSGQGANGIPPPRQTSALSSTVTIPDGSTIIIGGLNSSNVSETVNAVPILGQIPLLGYLFSSRDNSNIQSTLFVFIRPVILRDDQFRDLKYLSENDVQAAGIPSDYPVSEPLTVK